MKILFICLPAFICLLASCSKDDGSGPPAPTVKPDTLSTGWKKVTVSGAGALSDVFFNSAAVGYAAGDHLYKSVDGGNSWNLAHNSKATSLAMTADSKVFFVNYSDTIFRSADAGVTFTYFKVPGGVFDDVFFLDNLNGYCTGNGLYQTTDGGVTWTKITTTGIPFGSPTYIPIYLKNNTQGWLAYTNGIFRSNGSLSDWQLASIPGASVTASFTAVFATPNNNVYVSNGEVLYKSVDAGANFTALKTFSPTGFADIHFLDNNTGYISVGKRIYKTTDAGATWTTVAALGEESLIEIHFTDATHGWACGTNGTILSFN